MNTEDNKFAGETAAGAEKDASATEPSSSPTDAAAAATDPVEEWKNRVAYLSAEIDNMRKRFLREKTDVVRFANEELLKSLLPVLDNLQLAVKAVRDAESKAAAGENNPLFAKLLQGVDMVVKHFEQSLERVGVQSVPAVGEMFDPGKHEAIAQSENAQAKEGEVTAEMQKGYVLNGRLIRPARVVVNKAAPNS